MSKRPETWSKKSGIFWICARISLSDGRTPILVRVSANASLVAMPVRIWRSRPLAAATSAVIGWPISCSFCAFTRSKVRLNSVAVTERSPAVITAFGALALKTSRIPKTAKLAISRTIRPAAQGDFAKARKAVSIDSLSPTRERAADLGAGIVEARRTPQARDMRVGLA